MATLSWVMQRHMGCSHALILLQVLVILYYTIASHDEQLVHPKHATSLLRQQVPETASHISRPSDPD